MYTRYMIHTSSSKKNILLFSFGFLTGILSVTRSSAMEAVTEHDVGRQSLERHSYLDTADPAPSVQLNNKLRDAAYAGNAVELRSLLDAKANLNDKNERKETALCISAAQGHEDCVQILIDAKADINARDCR